MCVSQSYRAASQIAEDLRRWMRDHQVSQSDVARRLGIRQPQVSRILAGNFSLRSRAVKTWCEEAEVALTVAAPLRPRPERRELVALLERVWDGSAEDAARVAALLRAAADLR
jgi:predicted XRE-type DNA-binding protein